MSGLARPGVLAALLAGVALALHPSPFLARLLPAPAPLTAALLLLLALGLIARALGAREGRAGAVMSAAGAVAVVAGLAADGVLGHHGTLVLAVGEAATSFEETGRDGKGLGLRPLGFPVAAERMLENGVALMLPDRSVPVVLSDDRALQVGGYRLALPSAAEPAGDARILVHREPAAALVLAGALLLVAGSALLIPLRRAAAEGPLTPLVASGGALACALALVDRGAVLGWSYAVATRDGRVPLPGVGVLLGLAFVATLLGTLLLVAWVLSGAAVSIGGTVRRALWLGVALAAAGIALAVVRVAVLQLSPPAALVALAAAVTLVALALLSTRASRGPVARAPSRLWPAAAVAALAFTLLAGVLGLEREGTYATPSACAAASAALVGLAAEQPTPFAGPLRFAFLLALLALAMA